MIPFTDTRMPHSLRERAIRRYEGIRKERENADRSGHWRPRNL